MTIHLSKDLEQFVHDAVRAGLYAREDDVIRDALMRLKQAMPATPSAIGQEQPARPSGKRARRAKAAPQKSEPLTLSAFHRKLLAEGRISRLPDTAADFDDPDDQPITVEGEPLSETIIRERR
jgi:Arc/MetJ-type ribon-helix-helix transcriptional regulator